MTWKNSPRSGPRRPLASAGRAAVTALSLVGLLLAASPISAPAAGNAASGKELYRTRCLGCHGDGSTATTLGPSLVGIIGRKAGTGQSGVHSRIMTESGITWNETWLRIFLAAPTKEMPGTIMPVGVPDAQEIDDLIAYLETLR
jgi:cytochrome c2